MDLDFEKSFWGDCLNTSDEDQKHYVYAKYLNLPKSFKWSCLDADHKTILDIGGGPTSMLLKCVNLKKGKVIDPILFPEWVLLRYKTASIDFQQSLGEDISETGWDEVWIYNCLQHVEDPAKLIDNAHRAGKIIRLFDWLHQPYAGHMCITKKDLDTWLHAEGSTTILHNESGCDGEAYYGIFNSIYNKS